MTLTITPDGTATCLYSDLIPLTELGQVRVKRASWIDFNEASQQWEVKWRPDGDPVFSHPSREACLAWEHQQLDQ